MGTKRGFTTENTEMLRDAVNASRVPSVSVDGAKRRQEALAHGTTARIDRNTTVSSVVNPPSSCPS